MGHRRVSFFESTRAGAFLGFLIREVICNCRLFPGRHRPKRCARSILDGTAKILKCFDQASIIKFSQVDQGSSWLSAAPEKINSSLRDLLSRSPSFAAKPAMSPCTAVAKEQIYSISLENCWNQEILFLTALTLSLRVPVATLIDSNKLRTYFKSAKIEVWPCYKETECAEISPIPFVSV